MQELIVLDFQEPSAVVTQPQINETVFQIAGLVHPGEWIKHPQVRKFIYNFFVN